MKEKGGNGRKGLERARKRLGEGNNQVKWGLFQGCMVSSIEYCIEIAEWWLGLQFGTTKLGCLPESVVCLLFQVWSWEQWNKKVLDLSGTTQKFRRARAACSFPPSPLSFTHVWIQLAEVKLKNLTPADVTSSNSQPYFRVTCLLFKYNVCILGKTLAFGSEDVHSSSAACLAFEGSISFSAELALGWIICKAVLKLYEVMHLWHLSFLCFALL